MATEEPTKPNNPLSQLDNVGSAVRWTLGNLEKAFEEALEKAFEQALEQVIEPAVDEAFRTCNTIHTVLRDELGGEAPDAPAACEQPIAAEAARFRSCDGPITDGEPGEGLGSGGGARR